MPDAQNERTNSRGRRRGGRPNRGKFNREHAVDQVERASVAAAELTDTPAPTPPPAKFVRPTDITPPAERAEIYCTHHMALLPEEEPVNFRQKSEMTTLRHLPVDHFGGATLFCDCLHDGPHEWPPLLQRVETAIELDQFRTESTNEE